jgi:hypothetical protein
MAITAPQCYPPTEFAKESAEKRRSSLVRVTQQYRWTSSPLDKSSAMLDLNSRFPNQRRNGPKDSMMIRTSNRSFTNERCRPEKLPDPNHIRHHFPPDRLKIEQHKLVPRMKDCARSRRGSPHFSFSALVFLRGAYLRFYQS